MAKESDPLKTLDDFYKLRKQLEPVLSPKSRETMLNMEVLLRLQFDKDPELSKPKKLTHKEGVAKYYFN